MVDANLIEARMRGKVQTLQTKAVKSKSVYDTADAEDWKRLQEALKLMYDIDEKQLAAEVAEA